MSDRQQQREVVGRSWPLPARASSSVCWKFLHPEVKFVVHTEDGLFVTLGAGNVAARARVAGSAARGHAATVNRRPGVISWNENGTALSVLAFTVADGRITEVTAVIDPAQLTLIDLPQPV